MKNITKRSLAMMDELVGMRRFLHQNAEVGDDLPITTRYVMDKLAALGLEPKEISKSGLVATIYGGKPGKTILLRADMDALPMRETNNLEFTSKTEYAHTCGHDMHTAMLLGAAKMLIEDQAELCGNVKLMFQPAEEIFTGSEAMLKNGLMESPKVDASFDLHVMTELPPDTIAYRYHSASSSCDGFKITITGVSCHGAQPQNGIDPINVGCHLNIALQALIARETPPDKIAVLTICQFVAGSTANIIPESAVMQGTMRTYDQALRAKLFSRFKEVVEYTAKTFGAKVELEILSSVPSIKVDTHMMDSCLGYIKDLEFDTTYTTDYLITASDDYARISELVPSVFFAVGASPEDVALRFPNHNVKVIFNEACLPRGAAMFAQCAFEWLKANA